MVSFQCHNCGDVVKKPKLDQHRTRCHGGFDCIDCSTTFNSPAEYKGHTSCISEAEKYQKGLYKGPRTGDESAPKNNYPPQPASNPYPGGGSSWGRGGFREGRGGRGGFGNSRGGWGQTAPRGTGANDTPLGTPNRRSPVTQPIPTPVKEVPQPSVVEPSNDSCKSKKRKSMGTEDTLPPNGDAPSPKKAKMTQEEPAPVPLTDTQCEGELKKERKSKKKEKSTLTAVEKDAAPTDVVDNKERSKDEEKRKRKEKRKEDQAAAAAAAADVEGNLDKESKKKKKKKEKRKEDDISTETNKKEKKRKEREVVADCDVEKKGLAMEGVEKKKKKKKILDES